MATDSVVADLGFETAGRILASVAGRHAEFAAVGVQGELIWCGGERPDLATLRIIESLVARQDAGHGGESEIGERGAVLLHAICDVTQSPRAWLVAWTDEDASERNRSADWKRVQETLPRVAEMLSAECRLTAELSGAVRELGERYEELNMVFRMERSSRTTDPHRPIVREMLKSFIGDLGIDVGVLISKSCRTVLSSSAGNRKIPNLDFILTELRGKVWRFISASGEPLVINDARDERRVYLLTSMPFKVAAIPVGGCGDPDGGLILLRHIDDRDFTNSDLSLAQVFFGQAMVLLRNQALVARMERFTRQIANSLIETIEAKDPYTRGHSDRVERITAGLGAEVGIEEAHFADLLWGALLHDIGKIGIPDAILMKPGRLTSDEFTFIKTHPNRGYEILRHIEQLGPTALDAARYHHERFDGTGYPFGLRGDEIPIAARVVAVADTYDAVTSSRSYRMASTHEKAIEIVRSVAGTQLDPEIVRLFFLRIEGDREWLAAIQPNPGVEHDG
jgi:hypothetical protein